MAESMDTMITVGNLDGAADFVSAPSTTSELDISNTTVEDADETISLSMDGAAGFSGIDVTAAMATTTITMPSAQTQGSRDPSETRRQGMVHFEETEVPKDKGGGTKQKPRRYKIKICRPPYCKGDKLDSRTMSKYAYKRKIDHNSSSGIVKTFIDHLEIVGTGGGYEKIVCTLLHMTPNAVNKALYDNGLSTWCIKKDEEQTCPKLAILLQLSNGCTEYSPDMRRSCKILQNHLEHFPSDRPTLTEMIRIELGQFTRDLFIKTVDKTANTSDKFGRIVNAEAKEFVRLYLYLGSKAYHFYKIIKGYDKVVKMTEDVNNSIETRDGKDYSIDFTKVSHDLHDEVLSFLRIHPGASTESQLRMMNLNPEVQDPNLIINNKSNFEHAVDAIEEKKQQYISSVRDR